MSSLLLMMSLFAGCEPEEAPRKAATATPTPAPAAKVTPPSALDSSASGDAFVRGAWVDDLSEEQLDKLNTLAKKLNSDLSAAKTRRAGFQIDLAAALTAADGAAALAAADALAKCEGEMLTLDLDAYVAFTGVLDETQREDVAEEAAEAGSKLLASHAWLIEGNPFLTLQPDRLSEASVLSAASHKLAVSRSFLPLVSAISEATSALGDVEFTDPEWAKVYQTSSQSVAAAFAAHRQTTLGEYSRWAQQLSSAERAKTSLEGRFQVDVALPDPAEAGAAGAQGMGGPGMAAQGAGGPASGAQGGQGMGGQGMGGQGMGGQGMGGQGMGGQGMGGQGMGGQGMGGQGMGGQGMGGQGMGGQQGGPGMGGQQGGPGMGGQQGGPGMGGQQGGPPPSGK